MIDLGATVGRLSLPRCFMNSGAVRAATDPEIEQLAASRTGAIVLAPATLAPRQPAGAPAEYLDRERGTSIRSDLLRNPGWERHAALADRLRRAGGPPVVAGIAGFTIEEYATLARALGSHADAVEVDLAGPDLAAGGAAGSDPRTIERVVAAVCAASPADVWVKVPLSTDRAAIEATATVLARHPVRAAVVASGPFGLEVDVATETRRFEDEAEHTMIGGRDLLRMTLWNVREYHAALAGRVAVIGCGGIASAEDVYAHILCGAAAVQIGTACSLEGPGLFDRLESGLAALLEARGAASAASRIGALG